jgi:hypothetical protein
MEDRKRKHVLSGGWYTQWEMGEYKERVKEAECSGNIIYLCVKNGKMRAVDTIVRMRVGK